MGLKSSFSKDAYAAGVIDKQLGTSYDVVQAVYDNLDTVKNVETILGDEGIDFNAINTVAGIADDVTNLSDISADITTVANLNGSLSDVITNIDDIQTVGGDIAHVITVSTNITNVNRVGNSIINVNNVADNLSNISSVLSNEADISTVSDNMSDIVMVAANIDAIQSATANATAASNSASNASTSASEAATSASNASTSETNAGTSEINAADSATAAEASAVRAETAAQTAEEVKEAMNSVSWESQSEQRRETYGASGFVESGHSHPTVDNINQGLYVQFVSNTLYMGRTKSDGVGKGLARPRIHVDGSLIDIKLDINNSTSNAAAILLPEAEDGLTSAVDGSRYASHADAVAAGFNVVTNRKDLVLLEVWDELISDRDVVFPFGNVQYDSTTYDGINLSRAYVAQGYSAFHAEDTVTHGQARQWSTSSDAIKEQLLSDPKNNIRNTKDGLVQRRYRIRSIAGLQGDWDNVLPESADGGGYLRHNGSSFVNVQGASDVSVGLGSSANHIYVTKQSNWAASISDDISTDGLFIGAKSSTEATDRAYNGFCVALPIALVPRLNQGAFHPQLNPLGTRSFYDGKTYRKWHQYTHGDGTLQHCFVEGGYSGTEGVGNGYDPVSGYVGSETPRAGRPDGKYYDAIYAFGIQDLRLNLGMGLERINHLYEKRKRDGSASMRNIDMLPFINPNAYVNSVSGSGVSKLFRLSLDGNSIAQALIPDNGQRIYLYNSTRDSYVAAYVNNNQYGWLRPDLVKSTGDASNWDVNDSVTVLGADDPELLFTSSYLADGYYKDNIPAHSWPYVFGEASAISRDFPNGVYAEYIPHIPDGTSDTRTIKIASKKLLSGLLYAANDGTGWGTSTTFPNNFVNTSQSYNHTALDDVGKTSMLMFEYVPDFSTPSNLKRVDYSEFEVFAANCFDVSWAAGLVQTLIGEVPTNASPNWLQSSPLTKYTLQPSGNKFDGHSELVPEHDTISLRGTDSPAVKELGYTHVPDSGIPIACGLFKETKFDSGGDTVSDFTDITESTTTKNGGTKYHVTDGQFRGYWEWIETTAAALTSSSWHEVDGYLYFDNSTNPTAKRWDGNGFGDDNKFQPQNDLNYVTDYNGNTVKSGHVDFDIGIRHYYKGEV